MNNKRPVNLNLFTIRFPITAIVSILHRASGVFLFLLLPLLLWMFGMSLSSEQNYVRLQGYLTAPFTKLLVWLILAPLFYHLIAGIRHLLMDFHLGEERQSGRLGAQLTLIVSIIVAVLLGVWLW
jgi:succinate dehydrogenase / fumarate reductase cytochrome b subunit